MATDVFALEQQGLQKIAAAQSMHELTVVEKDLFGRKRGLVTEAMKVLRESPTEEKKKNGAALNAAKQKLEHALEEKRAEFERAKLGSLAQEDALDITMDVPQQEYGHLHLIPECIAQVEEVFGRMGFDTAYGPEIDDEEHNFDALNFPIDHASRDAQEIFYIKGGGSQENRRLLRGHTSTVQIRYAREHKPPFRMICPGKVYRKDADATHSPMFHQFEGMMIGKDISLRHLKGVMITAMKEILSPDLQFRFRTGYFPFTEPSMEMDVRWMGEKKTREGEWLEVAGCGMTHPNVLRNCGIDPEEWQGFAFGFGVERLVMIKHQIPNIKLFYLGDLRFLRQW